MSQTALLEPRGCVETGAQDAIARRELRRQIAGLERQLGALFVASFPRRGIAWGTGVTLHGPRLLTLGELEIVRDGLATRVSEARTALHERGRVELENRRLLERMLADPAAHRWRLISAQDIGDTGCRHWHSRPVLGPIGMIMGWWRVKISSGCPLPGAVPATTELWLTARESGAPGGRAADPRP